MAKDAVQQKFPQPVATPVNGAAVSPRIKPTKRRSRFGLWLSLTLILLVAGVAAWFFLSKSEPVSATAASSKRGGAGDKIRVVGAVAAKGDIGVYLSGLGSVIPMNTVTVRTRVDGQLMKVLFTEGQMVKAGDLLIQIDDRPYQAQLAQFKAQLEHDQALLDNAKLDLQRYQTLWSQDSIPQQQLDTQQALVKQDQGTVDSDQAQIDATQLNITYCNITAPLSGRIGLRLVDQGNLVHASDTSGLLVITQVQPITVTFPLAEDNLPPVLAKLHARQTLTVEARDRDKKQKLAEGTLLTTDNQIDPTTGTLKCKAIFPNDNNALFPNQFVNILLLVDTKHDVTTLPVAAIQYGTQGTFVYIVDTNSEPNTVTMQNVTVGTIDGDNVEISSGVTPGQTVVTDGVDKLQNGSKVILQSSGGGNKPGDTPAGKTADGNGS